MSTQNEPRQAKSQSVSKSAQVKDKVAEDPQAGPNNGFGGVQLLNDSIHTHDTAFTVEDHQ